jgi:hypothetical protein
MNKPVECQRCHVHMEVGYVVGFGFAGYVRQQWFPGEPKRSFWKGLRTDLKTKKDQIVPVVTLRCPSCGCLESYAIPQTTSER